MTKVKNYPVAEENYILADENCSTTMQPGKTESDPQAPILVKFLENLTDEVNRARRLSTRIDFLVNAVIDTGSSDDDNHTRKKEKYQNDNPCFTELINEEIDNLIEVNSKFDKIARVLEMLIGDTNED